MTSAGGTGRVRHYLARPESEKFFGLGEVSGAMDRRGGAFACRTRMRWVTAQGQRSALQAHSLLHHLQHGDEGGVRALLRHAVGLRVRLRLRAVELSRALSAVRGGARRSRFLRDRGAEGRRRDAAVHVAHGAAGVHAEMEPRLFGLDDELHGCAGRAGADERVSREVRRARHSVQLVPSVVGLHVDRVEALRLQLESREVSRSRRVRRALCGSTA